MEVKIKPIPKCMKVFLGGITLGVAPLMIWLNERNWPKEVDEHGLVTRGGAKIAWDDFTKITKVITRVGQTGSVRTEHYELRHPKGKVVVAVYRLQNGTQVFDYIWEHLPEKAKNQR